jgi:hypothetical protein
VFFRKKLLFGLLSLFVIIAGCSASIQEEAENTKKAVQAAFQKKPKEPNKKHELFSYYLPVGMEVQEEFKYNVLLKEGKKTYILFVNPKEKPSSKAMYESTVQSVKKPVLNETFKSDSRFGYVIISEVDNDVFEVTVGIGGVKMTIETKARSVSESAEKMMEIVSSVSSKEMKSP